MLNKRKILIVEDEFIIADKIERLLARNGYEVLPTVDSYEDAVELMKKSLPDLAILDIHIKGKKDGIELAEYIYKHFNLPVIFLSAISDVETIHRAKAAHPNTFILKSKPLLDEDKLVSAVEDQLLVSVNIALPEFSERKKLKTQGFFFKAKEVDLSHRKDIRETDPLDKEVLLRYDDICIIESNNQYEKNTVLVRTDHASTGFVLRATMRELEDHLPDHFCRIHDSFIINLKKVTARRLPYKLFIRDQVFTIGEKFKELTVEKVNLYVGL